MTVQVPLTRGLVALIDDDDAPEVLSHAWLAAPVFSKAGPQTGWYARRSEGRRNVYMHRLLASAKAGSIVDHINGDGLDNRRANLRLASASQNVVNRPSAPNSTGFRGVHFCDGRFIVRVQYLGKIHRIGRYDRAEEAARAYDAAAIRIHGEFAVLNFPREDRRAA